MAFRFFFYRGVAPGMVIAALWLTHVAQATQIVSVNYGTDDRRGSDLNVRRGDPGKKVSLEAAPALYAGQKAYSDFGILGREVVGHGSSIPERVATVGQSIELIGGNSLGGDNLESGDSTNLLTNDIGDERFPSLRLSVSAVPEPATVALGLTGLTTTLGIATRGRIGDLRQTRQSTLSADCLGITESEIPPQPRSARSLTRFIPEGKPDGSTFMKLNVPIASPLPGVSWR